MPRDHEWTLADLAHSPDDGLRCELVDGMLLVAVEVLSPSIRSVDLLLERGVCAESGVASYWLVDPAVSSVRALQLVDGDYVAVGAAEGDSVLQLDAPLPVRVVPQDLLDPQPSGLVRRPVPDRSLVLDLRAQDVLGTDLPQRAHDREQDRLPDRLTGQQRQEPVDAHALAAHRRRAVLERPQEVLVELHRLGITARGAHALSRQPPTLLDRVDQLGVARRELRPGDDEVPRLGQAGVVAVVARERTRAHREVAHERRVEQRVLDELLVQLEHRLSGVPALLQRDAVRVGERDDLLQRRPGVDGSAHRL
jgi:hypothetical protein